MPTVPDIGLPIRNLQTFLRYISNTTGGIPNVLPDGFYGPRTKASVEAFQRRYGLPVTGEVDLTTWNAVIDALDEARYLYEEPPFAKIFPDSRTVIEPGSAHESLYPIQGMLKGLTRRFPRLGELEVTGVHDEASVNVVKNTQSCCGLKSDGCINRSTWDHIAALYEAFVSRDRVKQAQYGPSWEGAD